jgi:hypothetical protein
MTCLYPMNARAAAAGSVRAQSSRRREVPKLRGQQSSDFRVVAKIEGRFRARAQG